MSLLAIAAFWGLLIICALSRSGSILALLFASMAFGSFAVVPPSMTGGVTFLGTPFVIVAAAAWAARTPGAFRDAVAEATAPNGLLLLTLFTVFAVLSAVILPRLLAGSVYVISVRIGPDGMSLLQPTSQNITQSFYLIVALTLVLVSFVAARRRPQEFYTASLIGGGILFLTGIADMIMGNSGLLAPFRTATYELHTGQMVGGVERIVGLMPEPSSFGSLCVSMAALVYFQGSGYQRSRTVTLVSGLIAAGLVVMAILSTSSTALIMLAVFVGLAVVSGTYSMVVNRRPMHRATVLTSLILGAVLVAALILLLAFTPAILAPIASMIDELVFQKVASDSFDERSSWNTAALDAFVQTNGLGVGLGSARASSWPVVILSNTGLLGAVLFGTFLLHVLVLQNRLAPPLLRNRANGAKLALLVAMTGATLSATSADFGGLIAICFGLILAAQRDVAVSRPRTNFRSAAQSK